MPYARPINRIPSSNGISIFEESRFSSVDRLMESESSTQHDGTSPSIVASDPNWQHTISTSFSQLSTQFQAAAQAVAAMPPTSEQMFSSLVERLESLAEGQRRLARDITSLQVEFEAMKNAQTPTLPSTPIENGNFNSKLEEALKAQAEAFKLEQERLPARLHNALATKSLSPIIMPAMKNKKVPPNSPNTRGEFEHLTKERYEALLTSFEVPYSGDTSAKRETLRAFLGIPSTPLK